MDVDENMVVFSFSVSFVTSRCYLHLSTALAL